MTRRLLISVITLAVLAAGCADTIDRQAPTIEGEPTGQTRGAGEYWMVWIHGNETLDPTPTYVCSVAFDHRIQVANRTLTYENFTYDFDPSEVRAMVAVDHWEEGSSCPRTYTLAPGHGPTELNMSRYGTLTLEISQDGTVDLGEDVEIQPGQSARYTYTATDEGADVTGSFVVEALGAWPQDRLGPER